jgi:hypothetical protein
MKSLSVRPLILCVQIVISTFPQGKEDVWVMPLLLSKLTYAIYKPEGSAKVGKLEGLREVMFFDDLPPIDLLFEAGRASHPMRNTPRGDLGSWTRTQSCSRSRFR